jgi:deoxycytidylate deaminase
MNSRIFQILQRLAAENPGVRGHFKLSAGIVYRNTLIATGLNSYKSHPMMLQFGKNSESIFIHAEIDAIKNALRVISVEQLSKCDLYIMRVKRAGPKNSRWIRANACPCAGCQRAIVNFAIRTVYYTVDQHIIHSTTPHEMINEQIIAA